RLRVWTKGCIRSPSINSSRTAKRRWTLLRKSVSRKVASGYRPPYAVYKKWDDDLSPHLALVEKMASTGAFIQTEMRVLYALDCRTPQRSAFEIGVRWGGDFGANSCICGLIAHAVSVPQKLIFQTRLCKEVQTRARRWNLLKNATDAGLTRSKRSTTTTPINA